MAVRVTTAGDYQFQFDYSEADMFLVGPDDHLVVSDGDKPVALFHRNHWAKAEIRDEKAES